MFFAATFVLASALVASAADINVAVGANNQVSLSPRCQEDELVAHDLHSWYLTLLQ